VADGLRELGYTTIYARADTVDLKLLSKLKARVVVFFRAPLDDTYEFLVKAFRANGSRIVFDVDDLVFDESIVSSIDGVRYLSGDQMEGYLWGVQHYRRFALEADLVTAATKYLVDYADKALGCYAVHIRNTLGKGYIKHYSEDRPSFERTGSGFVVGYYSGSKTHQADFQEVYPAITRFLRTYPDAVLRVVGMFDLTEFPDLSSVRDRIVSVSMLPYHEMIADLGNCDVVIAPLAIGNPFCEAKSELKFFEAALLGRPCVASATSTYCSATAGGQFGFVVKTDEEWFSALSELYLSPQLRRKVAKDAREYVLRAYSYATAGHEAASAYFGLPRRVPAAPSASHRAKKATRSHSIGVVMPAIAAGGGGHRKILKFCHDWAHDGHQLTLYVDSTDNTESIRRQIYAHYYEFPCEIRTYRGSVGHHAVIICTHWKTAFSLRNYPEREKVIYFVQDFEAMFDPVNSNYVKAIATYRLGFNIACYGQWVADRLRRELDLRATVIPFTMDKGLYGQDRSTGKVVDVLFFARPSQPRRCFELGVEALKQVYKANPAVRMGLFGEDAYGDLGFPYHNFGLVKEVSRLAGIYQRSKIGLCFSSTNPSLVGYEMIACGATLVDLRLPGYEVNFNGEEFVYYADPTPESIYSSIAAALGNEDERSRRVATGIARVSAMPDDSAIGSHLMTIVERICANN
jgi:glycosyltransferase involved in cell wall biosynthesis